MKNKESLIEKIERQAAGERAAGNHEAASTFDAKAKAMRQKYNLPPAVKEPSQNENEALRRKVEQFWESIDPRSQVVIEVLEPGMKRTVQRLTTMELALPLLKAEKARFVRVLNSSNEIIFAPQEVADEPSQRRNNIWV
jgi:hypothetical protein